MSNVRFKHDHERDPAVVEELAQFAISRAFGVPPLAVRVLRPRNHNYPTGRAYWGSSRPDWALRLYPRSSPRQRDMQAITVITVTDDSELLGRPHVCWHASRARDYRYQDPDTYHEQPEVLAAYGRGETKFGRWPIYTVHNWEEAFLRTFAHELSHAVQATRDRGQSEVLCETFAARTLDEWRTR